VSDNDEFSEYKKPHKMTLNRELLIDFRCKSVDRLPRVIEEKREEDEKK